MHNAPPFNTLWLTELLRLQEARDGPLDDHAANLAARQTGGNFNARVLARSQQPGTREELDKRLQQWRRISRFMFWLLCGLAILAGAGMALGALGDGARPVSLAQSLIVLLGLNSLMFLIWLLSLALPGSRPSGLGGVWLWLTARLSRTPEQALTGQALISLLQRAGTIKPLLGSLTHAFWALALTAAAITLLGVLSANQYSFRWETTLLSPDFFVTISLALGWLPAQLGFAQPTPEIILQSVSQTLPPLAEAGPLWSRWLLGCIITYGVIPRLLALAACLSVARYKIRRYEFDAHLPGLAELRPRLMPQSRSTGIDAPPPPLETRVRPNSVAPTRQPGDPTAFAGLELADDIEWPPHQLANSGLNLGRIDTRAQRTQLENTLTTKTFDHLIVVCDGRQTPDRGTVKYLQSLAHLCKHLHIVVLPPTEHDAPHRTTLWFSELARAGLDPTTFHTDMAQFRP